MTMMCGGPLGAGAGAGARDGAGEGDGDRRGDAAGDADGGGEPDWIGLVDAPGLVIEAVGPWGWPLRDRNSTPAVPNATTKMSAAATSIRKTPRPRPPPLGSCIRRML